jgi:hypothetical protein
VQDGKFGTVKLEVGRFLSALLRTNSETIEQRFLQLGILPLCLVSLARSMLRLWPQLGCCVC